MTYCEWYALCTNPAVGTVEHSVLGDVPVCQRCATKHDMKVNYYSDALADALSGKPKGEGK